MSEKIKLVTGNEQSQIVECLYDFIEHIDVGCKWNNEYLDDVIPSICIKQITSARKLKENIVGGYTAELPFAIYYKANVIDTSGTLAITKPLNDIALVFDEETQGGFQNIIMPNGYKALKLEMTSTPADESGKENNVAIFGAIYKLTYKKQGGI